MLGKSKLYNLPALARKLKLPLATVIRQIESAGILPVDEAAGERLYDRLAAALVRHQLNCEEAGMVPSIRNTS